VIRAFGQGVVTALALVLAALWYALGYLVGRTVVLAVWCWSALIQGYKAGL
jgi:hypothetical protein